MSSGELEQNFDNRAIYFSTQIRWLSTKKSELNCKIIFLLKNSLTEKYLWTRTIQFGLPYQKISIQISEGLPQKCPNLNIICFFFYRRTFAQKVLLDT